MNAPMEIRPARHTDAPELAALACELGYPSTAADLERRLAPLARDPAQLVLVATAADGRAIAWLHAALRRQLDGDDRIEIVGLVVTEAHRGAGVGARLLARAEVWAVELGVPVVQLRSNVNRERAHGFYLRAGYERVKTSFLFRRRVG